MEKDTTRKGLLIASLDYLYDMFGEAAPSIISKPAFFFLCLAKANNSASLDSLKNAKKADVVEAIKQSKLAHFYARQSASHNSNLKQAVDQILETCTNGMDKLWHELGEVLHMVWSTRRELQEHSKYVHESNRKMEILIDDIHKKLDILIDDRSILRWDSHRES